MWTRIGITRANDNITKRARVARQTVTLQLIVVVDIARASIETVASVTLIGSIARSNQTRSSGETLSTMAHVLSGIVALFASASIVTRILQATVDFLTSARSLRMNFVDRPCVSVHAGATSFRKTDETERDLAVRRPNTRTMKQTIPMDCRHDVYAESERVDFM
jgi:hypothetical protein